MKRKNRIKILNKKATSLLSIICFFILSINQCIAQPYIDDEIQCYGFIASPVKCENVTIQDQLNCKLRHMVNDFLREKIPVYWTTTDISAIIKEIDNESSEEIFFEKGSFIVPFTGNNNVDAKIIAIIYDYNQSCEISAYNELIIPLYLLMQPLDVQAYPLKEVKVAQFKSCITFGEVCYLEALRKCGFLSFEVLRDRTVKEKLNNEDFNVFLHACGGPVYASFYKTGWFHNFYEDFAYKAANTVRKFIANGGGYVGACYGMEKAASGRKYGSVTIHLKRIAYNPNLPCFGYYAIADIITEKIDKYLGLIQIKIANDKHPVSFRLDNITWDLHFGGPQVIEPVGENVQVIARFYNTNDSKIDGTPCWISSTFGNGKAVAFSPHPEIMSYKNSNKSHIGRTTLSNAIFYTTSLKIIKADISRSRPLSFILKVKENTINITINEGNSKQIFNKIKNKINETIDKLRDLNEHFQLLCDMINKIAEEKNVEVSDQPSYLGIESINLPKKHYLNLFIKYLENTSKTLTILEKTYPLLESETEIVKQIETLRADLSSRIDEMQSICKKCKNICMKYEEALAKYQKYRFRTNLKEIFIKARGHKLYNQIYSGFSHVPQIYFNSIKLLRGSWYNYEASIVL
ncbi:MAG: hypothetical protein KAW45_05415 [Thermoplasmatales archaeon]|nr:hypothetical protein [Thermoplasmatales archaeon]